MSRCRPFAVSAVGREHPGCRLPMLLSPPTCWKSALGRQKLRSCSSGSMCKAVTSDAAGEDARDHLPTFQRNTLPNTTSGFQPCVWARSRRKDARCGRARLEACRISRGRPLRRARPRGVASVATAGAPPTAPIAGGRSPPRVGRISTNTAP